MGLIDWSQAAHRVWNQIRAMQPWPTAYTFLHRGDQPPIRVIVSDAAPVSSAPAPGQPGELQQEESAEGEAVLLVYTGEGTMLRVLALQPAGKRLMTAAEFLRGHPVQPGHRFGPEAS